MGALFAGFAVGMSVCRVPFVIGYGDPEIVSLLLVVSFGISAVGATILWFVTERQFTRT